MLILFYSWFRRKELCTHCPSLYLWYGIVFFFFVLALGPLLHLVGKPVLYRMPTPYGALQKLFPPIKLSGAPASMTVMVMLVSSIITAIGLKIFFRNLSPVKMICFGLWSCLLFFEFLSKGITSSRIEIPDYIKLLKQAPGKGAVLDIVTEPPLALYYQTVHEKPLAYGYISRYPTSVVMEDEKKSQAFKLKSYEDLSRQYGVRFLITSYEEAMPHSEWLTVLYRGSGVVLYRIDDK